MAQMICQKIEKSPFKNVYWFARYLLNTDQYGGLGKNKETQLLEIVSILERIMVQPKMSDREKLLACKKTLSNEITGLARSGTKRAGFALNLVDTLDKEIETIEDVIIFCITMKYVVAPINQAIVTVPADDVEF